LKKQEEPLPNPQIEGIVKEYRKGNQYASKEMLEIYNISKAKNLLDFKAYKYKLMNKFFPLQIVLINMQLTTGQHMEFIVRVRDGGFRFDKGFYIIDDQMKYYNMSSGLWAFDYHEELCFPVTRKIDVNSLKNSLIKNSDVELETAINPVSLQKFMESTVIQKLLAGAELDKAMGLLKILMIIMLIVNVINLLVSLKGAGLLGGG
jgi:hypothetical protein